MPKTIMGYAPTYEDVVPEDLHKGAWTSLFRAQGISTSHHVWANEGFTKVIAFVAPESGPYEWMKRWQSTPQRVRSWSLVGKSGMGMAAYIHAIEQIVHNEAYEEVVNEYLPEGVLMEAAERTAANNND